MSLDDEDNDPKVMLSYVARALDGVQSVGERVFEALASPGTAAGRSWTKCTRIPSSSAWKWLKLFIQRSPEAASPPHGPATSL